MKIQGDGSCRKQLTLTVDLDLSQISRPSDIWHICAKFREIEKSQPNVKNQRTNGRTDQQTGMISAPSDGVNR